MTKEEEEEKPTSLTKEEIQAKIDDYNSKVSENGMKLVSIDLSTKHVRSFATLVLLFENFPVRKDLTQDVLLSPRAQMAHTLVS